MTARRMENLAPAGTREALDRAAAAGADAVYLGFSAFSARAGAGNFDEASLREAVAFAHLHHIRVHVAVNTLVKDGELDRVREVLRLLNSIPVDAVLIQDLGVLELARTCFPSLPVHASTQMAIHNAAGVRWCAKEGIRRAVLARECSLAEIALAAREAAEVEVFSHGAQCVSVSGECLFSSMAGGRSGNRGRCAQPCRMRYSYRGKPGAWLSPRDVCTRNDLPALQEAGVVSLKIEGRLKRPEYVAVTAASYRKGIDSAGAGSFQAADARESDALKQIFHRGGFMRGYAFGAEDAAVIDPSRVNHGGLPLGTVVSADAASARVRLTADLHDGDSLQFRTADGDAEMIYAGPETAAGETARLRLRPGLRTARNDAVYRLADASQLAEAAALPIPAIPADMTLTALPGQPLALTLTDGETAVSVCGEAAAAAENRALTEADARRCLEKTGGTPFALRGLQVNTQGAFVPVSALNALRREGLEMLKEARTAAFSAAAGPDCDPPEISLPRNGAPSVLIFRDPAQLSQPLPEGWIAAWHPEDWREKALEAALPSLPAGCWLQLPTVCEEKTLEMLQAFLTAHRDRFGGVLLGSVGQLGLDWPLPMAAGSGIPVMNRRAASFLLARGCRFVSASPELNAAETEALAAGNAPVAVPAYGRTQLMLLHHCPARTYLGATSGHASCALCDRRHPDALRGTALTDHLGHEFPLLRERLPEGCLVRLMNSSALNLLTQTARLARTAELTDETPEEAAAVLRALGTGEALRGPFTSGHWKRGVE